MTHTDRVEPQKTSRNKGGRPPKEEQNKASVKLNCWVTIRENEQLQLEFSRVKAGKRLAFAGYLKQKLFQERGTTPTKTNELLLTILINLQDRGRQLDDISKHVTAAKGSVETTEITDSIRLELAAIQEILTQISQWLYES
ncbi:hypothetical protein [Spirosoma sp. 209]|uniref:hypothetical protein n=1 Tax=Spirosoma sp. 209 TaxID=1955701 RepID=UPI00098D5E15|nr:hypothetical protein [Spirosoma sp. 209]